MEQVAPEKGSNIVLAVDPFPEEHQHLLEISTKILEKVHLDICALKINHQLVLPLGLFNGVQKNSELGS